MVFGRRKTGAWIAGLTAAALLLAPGAAASPNLIANGSFEGGVTTGWTSNSCPAGVEASNDPTKYGIPATTAGTWFIEVECEFLSPTTTADWAGQTVTTTSGERYFMSARAVTRNQFNTSDRMILQAAGVNLSTVTTTAAWAQYQASFSASAGTTIIRYLSNGSASGTANGGSALPGDSVGLMLDDAQVQELTVSPASLTTSEDTAVTTTAFDVAGNTGAATLSVSFAAGPGTVTLLSTTGLTVTSGSNGSSSVTVSGTAAALTTAFAAGVRYTPTADFRGTTSITFTVSAGAVFDIDIVPITVTPVADIVADNVTTIEGSAITFNAITGTNGASADNFENTPTAVSVTTPANGTASAAASPLGQITYTPNAGFFGTDSFNYTVTSGGATETGTITVTVRAKPRVTITKTSLGGTGGFTFTGSNGWSSQTITTTASGTPASGATQVLTSAGVATTITETPAAGYVLTSASCTGLGAGGTASLAGNTITLDAAAVALDASIACSFTNTKTPTLSLQKITLSGTGGPFSFSQTNLASTPAAITTTAASTATPASPTPIAVTTIGAAVTLTETSPGGFFLSTASCTDANSAVTGNTGSFGTIAGTTLTIAAARVVAGADFRCSFTNQLGLPALTVLKSANTAGPVAAGNIITYSYRVTNSGNVAVSGIAVADTHNGSGPLSSIANETLTTDAAPAGDSTDTTANNGTWSVLAPGDSVTFTATYTVTQQDIDTLQ